MLLINTFNLGSTQTGEAFELKQNRVLEWLPFTSITYSLLNTTPPSTSKLPHFSSWDLAMQSTGSGSWAYETPLHPGSPIPALLSIYPSPLQSAADFPPPPSPAEGLAVRKDTLTWDLTVTNRSNTNRSWFVFELQKSDKWEKNMNQRPHFATIWPA